MSDEAERPKEEPVAAETARGYARGVLGALLVSMPLLATMEMWWQGFHMPPGKMIVFLIANFFVLVILEYFSGFHESRSLREEALDALSAYGIGLAIAVVPLGLFDVLRPGMGAHEILGKIVLQSIPLSVGASIAISQLGQSDRAKERRKARVGPLGGLALSLAGAWYFGFNVAATEEPLMIAAGSDWYHPILLVLASLVVTHAIVYSVDFVGGRQIPEGSPWWEAMISRGAGSTAVALVAAAFFLWIFGRIGLDTGLAASLQMVAVLGFVNSLGAAAAKLIL